jgi:adenine-specific DNA methylase
MEIIQEIFQECYRVLKKENGRFVFTFHHWNPKGWAALTIALKQANFILVNRYVVHAENPISVHIANMNALMHDAILVFAPVEAGIRQEWERPFHIDRGDSHTFCRDCATLMGWMLNQDLETAEIETLWQQLF